jgi:hypothetical protein
VGECGPPSLLGTTVSLCQPRNRPDLADVCASSCMEDCVHAGMVFGWFFVGAWAFALTLIAVALIVASESDHRAASASASAAQTQADVHAFDRVPLHG